MLSLTQIYSEYTERMKQAAMLESHIVEARARATAKETQAQARLLEEVGEGCDRLGLYPGEFKPQGSASHLLLCGFTLWVGHRPHPPHDTDLPLLRQSGPPSCGAWTTTS